MVAIGIAPIKVLHKNNNKVCLSVCLSVCLCVCMSLANDSSETSDAITIKLGTVTASDMIMLHVLIILTMTFIQGHTGLNHENNKCSIKTVQAILI